MCLILFTRAEYQHWTVGLLTNCFVATMEVKYVELLQLITAF